MKVPLKSLIKRGFLIFTTILISLVTISSPVYASACSSLPNNLASLSSLSGYGDQALLSELPTYYSYLSQVHGVTLDQAATFMQDMSDITGAYYDQATNRIVLVGTKNTDSTPVFNKDDLAVAVRSLVFDNAIPQVSIGQTWSYGQPTMNVTFSGQVDNTSFGDALWNADYLLKQYFLGYNPSQQPITSSVPTYESALNRYLAQDPGQDGPNLSSFVISPAQMTLEQDPTTGAFAFSQASMQVTTTPIDSTNSAKWNQAASALAQDLTTNYDSYAQEQPYWQRVKELAKMVAVVKWLKDNNIATDYTWAKNYTPNYVATPTSVNTIDTPNMTAGGYTYSFEGGIDYSTPNTYVADNGTADALKTAAQSSAPSPESNNWTFTQNGQQYETVAVDANAFRSVGAYTTKATDLSIGTRGDTALSFSRAYDSQAKDEQEGIGNGWTWQPAQLYSAEPWNTVTDSPSGGFSGTYPVQLTYQDLSGDYETFTYNTTTHSYQPDRADYHTQIVRNSDGSFSAVAKDQSYYKFSGSLVLLLYKDRNNNGIYYQYDGTTHITRIDDDANHEIKINYNSNNEISSVVDWLGRTVTYGYDSSGNLTSVTDPMNNTITYTYDSSNRLATIKDRQGRLLLSNTYNDEDKVASIVTSTGVTINYTYDETNRIVTATDSNGNTVSTSYDQLGRVTQLTDPNSNSVSYTYGTEPRPLTVKDKNGNTTTYTYDSNGNVATVTDAKNNQIAYTYNSQNLPTQITDNRYSPGKVTTMTYDSAGNMLSKVEAGITTNYTYDSTGNMTSSMDGLGHKTTYTYDSLGDKISSTDPLGTTTNYTYDPAGRLTQQADPSNNSTSYTYDSNNNVLTVTTAAGTTTNQYSPDNQLTQTTDPDGHVTSYAYDAGGQPLSTTDAQTNLTSYGYDQYENLVSKQNALTNTTNYTYDKLNRQTSTTAPGGQVTKWTYDANGNLVSSIDASNRTTSYQYDSLNRLVKTTYPDNSTVNYTYDNRGNITQMVDPSGTTNYTYDNYDRLTSVTDPNNSTVNYTYDAANNITQITYPGSKSVNYTYTGDNQLRTVSDWNNSTTNYEYSPNGTLFSKILPNGITQLNTYDGANRLSSLQYSKSGQLVSQYSYARNGEGNVTTATENDPTSPSTFTVYDESLASGWSKSWSWDSTTNLSDTSNPYSGTHDISWKVTAAWGGLHIRDTQGMFNTAPYNAITFAMKATQPGQEVVMNLKDANDNDISSPVDISIYGGQPNSSGYTVYTIPLSAWGATGKQISALTFEDNSGKAEPNMYIDSIKFTTATPSAITPYTDSLNPDFADWSWSTTNNFSDTSQPYSGTSDLKATYNSGYGGMFIQDEDGFNTTGYSTLSFALKAPQPGQQFSVQFTDNQGNQIGSQVNLDQYGDPAANAYTMYNIPISDLHAANMEVYGMYIQNQTGTTPMTVYIDNIKLVPTVATPSTSQQSTYTYDSLGRLTAATVPGHTYAYTYDAAGNRLTSKVDGTTTTSSFNTDNQKTSQGSRSFTYDNQGNEITDNSKSLAYSFTNLLKSYSSGSTTINYVYDGKGDRIAKNIGSTPTYQYVNDVSGPVSRVLEAKNLTNSSQEYYVYGDDLLDQSSGASSSNQYFLDDGLGSLRLLTDNSGNTVQSFTYDPFGNQLTGSTATNYTFQSQQVDQENGLFYLGARYYDPTTGDFLSQDPLSGSLTNPQAQNGYDYANDNPVNMFDPTGESAISDFFNSIGNAIGNFFSNSGSGSCALAPGAGTLKVGGNPAEARAEAGAAGVKIPSYYVAERAENGQGWVFRAPGSEGDANTIRVGEPDSQNPTGYIRVYNEYAQPVTSEGLPGSNADTHLPLRAAGEEPIDELPFDFPF